MMALGVGFFGIKAVHKSRFRFRDPSPRVRAQPRIAMSGCYCSSIRWFHAISPRSLNPFASVFKFCQSASLQ